jgi:hypothetical protein
MTARPNRRRGRESHRLASCALRSCSRLFSVCGSCDRGRRYCSASCSAAARRRSVRRAGRQYQRTERGRRLHAIRQARYRERQAHVTHHAQGGSPGSLGSDAPSCFVAPPRGDDGTQRPAPPDCALCGRHGELLRRCFRRSAPPVRRRTRTRQPHTRPKIGMREPAPPVHARAAAPSSCSGLRDVPHERPVAEGPALHSRPNTVFTGMTRVLHR